MQIRALGLLCLLTISLVTSVAKAEVAPDAETKVAADFEQLVVTFEPNGLSPIRVTQELKFEPTGTCWYKALPVETGTDKAARGGGVFQHVPSNARLQRIHQLLQATEWLSVPGANKPIPQLHASTVTITLKRNGKQTSVTCVGEVSKPYAALLHELNGIAAQEYRIYLKNYVAGEEGNAAWQEIGRELAALRGEPYSKSLYDIDYGRYLPIAQRIIRSFHGKPDDELVPAIRLIAYLNAKSDLQFLHRLADDRSGKIRQEVAIALGKLHEHESLPVLVNMMSAAGTSREVGFELIQWGPDAVPAIVHLIEQSTDGKLEERERVPCEEMIRAYLDNWNKISKPIDPEVVTAVRKALDAKDPMNGIVRTQYHAEFLKQASSH